jgi:hypothetical protein
MADTGVFAGNELFLNLSACISLSLSTLSRDDRGLSIDPVRELDIDFDRNGIEKREPKLLFFRSASVMFVPSLLGTYVNGL